MPPCPSKETISNRSARRNPASSCPLAAASLDGRGVTATDHACVPPMVPPSVPPKVSEFGGGAGEGAAGVAGGGGSVRSASGSGVLHFVQWSALGGLSA